MVDRHSLQRLLSSTHTFIYGSQFLRQVCVFALFRRIETKEFPTARTFQSRAPHPVFEHGMNILPPSTEPQLIICDRLSVVLNDNVLIRVLPIQSITVDKRQYYVTFVTFKWWKSIISIRTANNGRINHYRHRQQRPRKQRILADLEGNWERLSHFQWHPHLDIDRLIIITYGKNTPTTWRDELTLETNSIGAAIPS